MLMKRVTSEEHVANTSMSSALLSFEKSLPAIEKPELQEDFVIRIIVAITIQNRTAEIMSPCFSLFKNLIALNNQYQF